MIEILIWIFLKNEPMKKVCKKSVNCDKIEITQQTDFLSETQSNYKMLDTTDFMVYIPSVEYILR